MTSIIRRDEADKRQAELRNMDKPNRVTVSKVKWKYGSSGPSGAAVILSNGRYLDCQVQNVIVLGDVWCAEIDVRIKFNDYSTTVCFGSDRQAESLRVADVLFPEKGKLQGTQVVLNDGSYLSLIQGIRFVENGLRVKVRINNETTTTQAETTDSQGTETNQG